jgi:transcriptional regulator with XRE-family HTH domain
MAINWSEFIAAMKRRRARLGITQAELARRMDVQIATIGRLEIGNRRPSIEMLEKLAEALECRVRDLLVEETAKRTPARQRRKGGNP